MVSTIMTTNSSPGLPPASDQIRTSTFRRIGSRSMVSSVINRRKRTEVPPALVGNWLTIWLVIGCRIKQGHTAHLVHQQPVLHQSRRRSTTLWIKTVLVQVEQELTQPSRSQGWWRRWNRCGCLILMFSQNLFQLRLHLHRLMVHLPKLPVLPNLTMVVVQKQQKAKKVRNFAL